MSSIPFLNQAKSLFSSLTGGLQLLAVVLGGVAGIVIFLQMIWASQHGNMQKRQEHLTHLEWVAGSVIGVYAFAEILSYVAKFFH